MPARKSCRQRPKRNETARPYGPHERCWLQSPDHPGELSEIRSVAAQSSHFFTLFAFALNNQQVVSVNFFFGTLWQAPLVLVVLAAFSAGLALGVLVMMPRWWKKRRLMATAKSAEVSAPNPAATANPPDQPHGI